MARAFQAGFDFVEQFEVNFHLFSYLESQMNPICKGLSQLPLCVYLGEDLI